MPPLRAGAVWSGSNTHLQGPIPALELLAAQGERQVCLVKKERRKSSDLQYKTNEMGAPLLS